MAQNKDYLDNMSEWSEMSTHGLLFQLWSGQTRYNIGICCFSDKLVVLRSKGKDWLAQNQDNVSEWSDMSIHGLLFQ